MDDINLHYRFLNWRRRIREIREVRAVRYQERYKRILVDGDTLSYQGNSDEVGCYVAPRSLSKGNCYFEVTIVDTGVRGTIAVGLVPQHYKLDHQPGWLPHSIAYHADDGKLYNGSTVGKQFGLKCITGDRIGCGIYLESFETGLTTVFFTKNGKEVGSVVFPQSPDGLFPAVGMHSLGEEVRLDLHAEWGTDEDDSAMMVDSHEDEWGRLHDVKVSGTSTCVRLQPVREFPALLGGFLCDNFTKKEYFRELLRNLEPADIYSRNTEEISKDCCTLFPSYNSLCDTGSTEPTVSSVIPSSTTMLLHLCNAPPLGASENSLSNLSSPAKLASSSTRKAVREPEGTPCQICPNSLPCSCSLPSRFPLVLLEYVGKGKSILDVGLALARHPLSTRCHYFEVEIMDAGEKCYIALGLARRVSCERGLQFVKALSLWLQGKGLNQGCQTPVLEGRFWFSFLLKHSVNIIDLIVGLLDLFHISFKVFFQLI
ncbi:SPRY3 protein, partial [Polyodon spathula]|nr:SPRY3 protein [Polyodon spathula]